MDGIDSFKVKKYLSEHTYILEIRLENQRQVKCSVIGHLTKSKYEQVGRTYRPRYIIENIQQDYGANITYEKA